MERRKHTRRAGLRPKESHREYLIWCDESEAKGRFCSNFYGGVLVRSEHLKEVQTRLRKICDSLHFRDEIKWQKVSEGYLDKYIAAMDVFFDIIKEGKAKVRIMFTQNAFLATHLTQKHKDDEYFVLYYQFIKHAFGLQYSNDSEMDIYLRLYFDNLPDTLERRNVFKNFVKGLQKLRPFQLARLKIRKQDIAEIDSKKHLLLQMLDVVLGSMCFRLNNRHKEIPPGKKRRGKRTIAKEKLYQHITKRIRELRPGFNIGSSTGKDRVEDFWNHSYRHWVFRPVEHEIDKSLFK